MSDKTDPPDHIDTAGAALGAMIHGMTTEEAGDALSSAFFLAFVMMGDHGVSDNDRRDALAAINQYMTSGCGDPSCPGCAARTRAGSLH